MYINNDIDYIKYLSKKEVVIFGAGENGKTNFFRLSKNNIKIVAFCDNDKEKQNHLIYECKVISFDELLKINHSHLMIVICSNYEGEIKKQLLENDIFNFISVTQIDFGGGQEYYDEQYFSWQKRMGEFGGKIKSNFFKPYIKEYMTVIEFGSGGGYLLKNICAKEKIGIEINDTARLKAKEIGIHSVKNISELKDNYADVIISTSVLEHVENPLGILRELKSKLKDEGKIIFHVPNESCNTEYERSEVNNHLYTWNCLNLGNLFKAAGYFVYSVQNIREVWTKNFFEIDKEISFEFFDALCEIGGAAFDKNSCIIVAYK